MAKKQAELLIKIKAIGTKSIKKVRSTFDSLKKNIVAGAAVAATAMFALKKAFDFAIESSQMKDVERSFNALAASQGKDAKQMLQNMRELSQGTVSDMKLMQAANQSLLLGLPVDRFGDMLKIARSSAKATGQSMDFMLNSIVTGLGRGSKLMLDNTGIIFKVEEANEEYARSLRKTAAQLTEAEKKQAFINKALAVGIENTRKAGDGGVSLADKWQQLKASTDNLFKSLGNSLIPAMTKIVELSTDIVKAFDFGREAENSNKSVEQLNKEIDQTVKQIQYLEKGGSGNPLSNLFGGDDAALDKARKNLSELVVARVKAEQAIAAVNEGKRLQDEADKEAELIAQQEHNLKLQEIQAEKDLQDYEISALTGAAKLEQQLALKNAEIKNEQNFAAKKKLVQEKASLTEQLIQAKKSEALVALEKKEKQERLRDQQVFLSTAASLQSSGNKALAAIGKAAAMTQIAIDTQAAASSSFKFGAAIGGPPLGAAFAAIAVAAGAARAARVAGIQLADGGIVQATQGGTPAILGEGGRDEAVVPLDSGGPLGNSITINTQFFMGDELSARQAAVMIDKELLRLRQDNESLAFDSDVV